MNETRPHLVSRPNIPFYDGACKRRRNHIAHSDPLREGTINIVDR